MKKRFWAVVCLLAALLILLVPWSAAASPFRNVYLLGVNDTVMLNFITADLMPVRRGGAIYAPCTLLDNKDLGLSYTINRTQGTFTVFNRKQALVFQLNRAGAVDREGNAYNDERIISRNGVVFFPLRFVVTHFELSYSFYNLVLPEGTVPIARICTSRASLSDSQFGASAAALVAAPLRQYMESRATPSPSPSAAATPSAAPSAAPSAQPTHVDLSFAVACVDGAGFQRLLESFASARYSALFLFSPQDLTVRDADVRAAAAAGHQIGLLLSPETPEEDLLLGNRRLAHILRSETNQVAFLQGGAKDGEWRVWTGNVSPRGGSVSAQAENLMEDINARSTARVTLNDSQVTAQALQRNLRAWSQRPYTLITPTA